MTLLHRIAEALDSYEDKYGWKLKHFFSPQDIEKLARIALEASREAPPTLPNPTPNNGGEQ